METMKRSCCLILGWIALLPLQAEESFLPAAVAETDFGSLVGQSPFSRALNLSDLLILTGIATVGGEQVATLINRETKESYVVSSRLNSQGWKMVELKPDVDLEKVSARVAVEGGEVVTVRYAESQLKPGESKPGTAPGEGGEIRDDGRRGEGSRRGPPPEMREKMMKLSEEQRGKLFQQMREIREKNPEMPREEMGRMMSGMMDRMLQQK